MKTTIAATAAAAAAFSFAAPANAQYYCFEAHLPGNEVSCPAPVVEVVPAPPNQEWVIPLLVLGIVAAAASGGSSTAATAAAPLLQASDARLKTNIVPTGESAAGFDLYRFSYIGHEGTTFEGVMAQDVLASRPDAVFTGPNGYLGVDYGALGIEMRLID